MKELEDILKKIALPIKLPTDVFVLFGKERKIPDFEIIFTKVLPELNELLEPNGTARNKEKNIYLFPLIEDGHLAIKIDDQSIVKLIYISPTQQVSESLLDLLNQLKQ